MKMHEPTHPDDERLSALAGGEDDALADASLREHVSTCDRCSGLVRDISRLAAALADLPDLAPSRPLRFLPPAAERAPSGAWWRRLFAPVLVAGSGLVLVGAIGFSGVVENLASGASGAAVDMQEDGRAESDQSPIPAAQPSADSFYSPGDEVGTPGAPGERAFEVGPNQAPWLVVIITGVALITAALALRFVVQPRAG